MPLEGVLQFLGYFVLIGLASWMGARFGAYAVLPSMLPLPIMGWHYGKSLVDASYDLANACVVSILSFVMVTCWAVSMRLSIDVITPRTRAWRPWQRALVAGAASIVLASIVGIVHLPLQVTIAQLGLEVTRVVAPLIAAACVGVAALLLRHPRSADAPVASGHLTWPNLILRFVLIFGLVYLSQAHELLSLPVVIVLGSVPRATTELVVGTWIDNDDDSAREVLAGLAIGLLPTFVWLSLVPWTVPALGGTPGLLVAAVPTVGVWALNLTHVVRSDRTWGQSVTGRKTRDCCS